MVCRQGNIKRNYFKWSADLEDTALKAEWEPLEGNDEEIRDHFAVAL